VSDPSKTPSKSVSLKAGTDAHKWNGIFSIYDRSGKENLLAKAVLRMRANEKKPAKLSPTTIRASRFENGRKTETNYWLETGHFVVSSGEVSVIEQILRA